MGSTFRLLTAQQASGVVSDQKPNPYSSLPALTEFKSQKTQGAKVLVCHCRDPQTPSSCLAWLCLGWRTLRGLVTVLAEYPKNWVTKASPAATTCCLRHNPKRGFGARSLALPGSWYLRGFPSPALLPTLQTCGGRVQSLESAMQLHSTVQAGDAEGKLQTGGSEQITALASSASASLLCWQ